MPLIEIQHLTKMFYPARTFGAWVRAPWQRGQPVTALHDVSLTIERGELCCLMGSNGAGKTTLLKTLIGLLLPTSGVLLIDGQTVQRRTRWLTSQIGFASSDRPGFYDRLTGRQNLAFFASLYGLSGRAARARIDELHQLLQPTALDRQYQEYSAGMKQRLLLARALLHDPPVLLLDEPTKSLDPSQTEVVQRFIGEELHRRLQKTILLTTHNSDEAERLADHVAILHRGVIRARGSVQDVAQDGAFRAAIQRMCG